MKPEHRVTATPHLLVRHQDFRGARRDAAAGREVQLRSVLSYEPGFYEGPDDEDLARRVEDALMRHYRRRSAMNQDTTPTAHAPAMFQISYGYNDNSNSNTCTTTHVVTAGNGSLDDLSDVIAVELGAWIQV